MAKQLQLRRGSFLENETFIGAEAEMTFDTERKDIRIHDGVKRGGYMVDTLVDFQIPTDDNGYTWYRKYASGWVEQGGETSTNGAISATNKRITMPVEMANTRYTVGVLENANSGNSTMTVGWESRTSFSLGSVTGSSTGKVCWIVSGMAA